MQILSSAKLTCSCLLYTSAEKFHRPVVCFVDTAGAFCGIAAEERGQAQAIAENLYEMMTLKTPILSIFIGEGGSGGALGLAVADEVWMLENAVYSVISPEGCASILWKDSSKAVSYTHLELQNVAVSAPTVPLYANYTAEHYAADAAAIKENIAMQVNHPVPWQAILKKMAEEGVTDFVEVGPGKTLAGLVRCV